MKDTNRLPGHELVNGEAHGIDYARCTCGDHSDNTFPGRDARLKWLSEHKDTIRATIRETVITAPTPFPYMTSIPDRVPAQKPHTALGQAKKAVLFRLGYNPFTKQEELLVDCNIYEWTAAGWSPLYTIKAGTTREAMPWLNTRSPRN